MNVNFLAGSDVKTQRRRVVVLEEVQAQTILRRELNGLSGTSLAISGGDNIAVARLQCDVTKVLLDSWSIAPRSLLARGTAELCAAETAGATESVIGRLKILLLREEEDDGTLLSVVLLRDVEVEDCAHSRVDLTVVTGTVGLIRVLGGNGYNQVRGLISASERCLAGWALCRRSSGSARCWRSLAGRGSSGCWRRRRLVGTCGRSRGLAGACRRSRTARRSRTLARTGRHTWRWNGT